MLDVVFADFKKEMVFEETDVWELSGVPMDKIKRRYIQVQFAGESNFEIRVATIEAEEGLPTLLLCHNYMSAACIQWFRYVEALSKHFRLVMPDMGTYGANTRINSMASGIPTNSDAAE